MSAIPLILSGAACGTADGTSSEPGPEQVGRIGDALSIAYNNAGLPILTASPFPSGFAGAVRWNVGGATLDPTACRNCSTTGVSATPPNPADDLGPGLRGHEQSRPNPTTTKPFGAAAEATSVFGTYANTLWSHGSAGGLKQLMRNAQPTADQVFDKDASNYGSDFVATVDRIMTLIDNYPGIDTSKVHPVHPVPKYWSIAFKPIHSRFRSADTVPSPTGPVTTSYNPQPEDLAEVRLRGARSYCAMRECARAERAVGDARRGMGLDSGASWWKWTFGATEGTVKVANPTSFETSNGAHAFVIPIALGAKITPLSGPLLPSFMPEFVHPLVWVTGDSQVGELNNSQSHVSSQHADFWAGEFVDSAGVTIDAVTLMTWGVISLRASGGIDFTAGMPVEGLCDTSASFDSVLGDGRVLATNDACSSNRKSRSWELDKPLITLASEAPIAGFQVEPGYDILPYHAGEPNPFVIQWVAPRTRAMNTRMFNDDDRSVVLLDRVKEWLTLDGLAGVNVGPITVGVIGSTTLSAEVHHYTSVREQVSIVKSDKMLPTPQVHSNEFNLSTAAQTNLVVASRTTYNPVFNPLTLTALFDLNICFPFLGCKNVHWSDDFVTLGNAFTAPTPKVLPEHRRLRVGIYSDYGKEFSQQGNPTEPAYRNVFSHQPDTGSASNPAPFTSWPPARPNVTTCLADDVPVPPPPIPDDGDEGIQPAGFTCHYGLSFETTSSGMPPNVCTDTVPRNNWIDFWTTTAAQVKCLNDVMNYLCGGTHREQTWGVEGRVVSRVYQSTQATTIANILGQCAVAYNTATNLNAAAEQASALVRSMLHMHACKSNATLE